jgi:hypothetical protein
LYVTSNLANDFYALLDRYGVCPNVAAQHNRDKALRDTFDAGFTVDEQQTMSQLTGTFVKALLLWCIGEETVSDYLLI